MVRRTRAEAEETRVSLLATARRVFAEQGYAQVSMDDLTRQAGLTRGALYHHFGDKKGLLAAVVLQIDQEMEARLQDISESATSPWEGFRARCHAHLQMALEPEYQRIVLRDAKAVLGDIGDNQSQCIATMARLIDSMIRNGIIDETDPEALALLIFGSLSETSAWIADEGGSEARLRRATCALDILLRGIPNTAQPQPAG
ncbi:TetR/AcrR family transcriptional regulator [Leisingera sp.]|uniref:TetR/AcrR family transcriptional regulator n=1 Tax=Leisingera sp. TaxID=1879318 RepID=UPI002B26C0CB|nr:TetR/AcrR family transcriptional regulator [Leisingera sp.]